MYRMSREELEFELRSELLTAMREHKAVYRSRNPVLAGVAENKIIDVLINAIDNTGRCVMSANSRGLGHDIRPGRFGEDEPWPT